MVSGWRPIRPIYHHMIRSTAQVVSYGADTALPTAHVRYYRDILVCIATLTSKLKKDAEKGSGKRAKWPIPAMPRATGLACGNARIGPPPHNTHSSPRPRSVEHTANLQVMALGVLLQCHSSWPDAAVYLHMAGSAVSVQAAAAAIAAAATRDASASLSAAR